MCCVIELCQLGYSLFSHTSATRKSASQERESLAQFLRCTVLELVGEIWLLRQRYLEYPYALCRVCMPGTEDE